MLVGGVGNDYINTDNGKDRVNAGPGNDAVNSSTAGRPATVNCGSTSTLMLTDRP